MSSNVFHLELTAEERLRFLKRAKGRSVHAGDALQMLIFVGCFVVAFAAVMTIF